MSWNLIARFTIVVVAPARSVESRYFWGGMYFFEEGANANSRGPDKIEGSQMGKLCGFKAQLPKISLLLELKKISGPPQREVGGMARLHPLYPPLPARNKLTQMIVKRICRE